MFDAPFDRSCVYRDPPTRAMQVVDVHELGGSTTAYRSAQNIVLGTGIGTPSLARASRRKFQGAERGAHQFHELPEARRRAKFMGLMNEPNGATQEFYYITTSKTQKPPEV